MIQGYPQRMRRLYGLGLVHFLHSEFLEGQNWLITVLNHLVNHQYNQLNAETKTQSSSHIFRVLGVSYFVGNPAYFKLNFIIQNNAFFEISKLRSTPVGRKDIVIRKSEFLANNQFIYFKKILTTQQNSTANSFHY